MEKFQHVPSKSEMTIYCLAIYRDSTALQELL